MAITSINALVGVVGEARLLDPPQQDELVRQLQRQYADPKSLAKALIERGWLTAFQIRQLVQGKGSELVLGQYVLLDVIGEGGMGKVFKARQRSLGRIVALKVIREERLTNNDAIRRFKREITATSQMAHPNIVRAVDADQIGNTLFIAMEFVDGIDLSKLVKRDGPLPVGQACEFIRQGALGLQHAHECGLVHRDVKPSNLIVTRTGPQGAGFGLVKILDLGLARAVEPSIDDSMTGTLTHAGSVIGTPDYISPEQARDSRTVDIRSDLYSLGCTLYYLLTAQVPFPGGTGMEKLFKHQLEAPPPLPQLRSGLPRGLVNVVVSLMAKKPEERPQTPAEAAVLLQAFANADKVTAAFTSQAKKPTQTAAETDATPRSFRTRGQAPRTADAPGKPKRRLLLGMAVIAVGLFLTAGSAFMLLSGGSSASTKPGATEPFVKTGTGKSTERQAPLGLDQLDASRIPAAERLPDLPVEVVAVLGEHRFRHWGHLHGAAFSPDGKWLATIGSDRQLRIWNLATGEQKSAYLVDGQPIASATLAFSPNGQTIAIFSAASGARVLDLGSGKQIFSVPNPKAEGRVMALSPDAQSAVMWGGADRSSRLWHLGRNAEIRTLESITFAHNFAFSSDGKWLAGWPRYGGAKNNVTLWDVAGTREPITVALGSEQLLAVAIHSDGPTLAVATLNNQLKIWNPAGSPAPTVRELAGGRAFSLTYAPDGKTLAISGTGQVRLHNLATGQEKSFASAVMMSGQLMFSPDSRTIAGVGGFDAQVRLWDVATAQENRPSQGHGGFMSSATFAGDGRTLVTSGGFSGGVKAWNLFTGKARPIGEPGQGNIFLAVLPDNQTLLTRSANGLALWDLDSGARKTAAPLATNNNALTVAATPNGQTVATFLLGQLKIWDGRTLQERTTLPGVTQAIYLMTLSPDGQKLAAVEYGAAGVEARMARVRLWSLTDNKEMPSRPGFTFKGSIGSVAFSPDGQLLAASGADGSVRVWNANTGQERFSHLEPGVRQQTYLQLAFSADGQTLAAWGSSVLKAWDLAAGKERPVPKQFQEDIAALTIAPNGKLLAACDRAGRIICWNATSGVEVHRLQLPGAASGLRFAPDSRHLASSNSNGTIYILRLPS